MTAAIFTNGRFVIVCRCQFLPFLLIWSASCFDFINFLLFCLCFSCFSVFKLTFFHHLFALYSAHFSFLVSSAFIHCEVHQLRQPELCLDDAYGLRGARADAVNPVNLPGGKTPRVSAWVSAPGAEDGEVQLRQGGNDMETTWEWHLEIRPKPTDWNNLNKASKYSKYKCG